MNGSNDLVRPAGVTESYSSISTYLACPLRYRFRYVERVPFEARPAQFALGSAIHRAFEVFIRQRIDARHGEAAEPDVATLRTAFDACIEGSGCAAEDIERFRARGRPMLERFATEGAMSPATPIGVEMGFGLVVPMPDGVPLRFVGYVDRIDVHDAEIEVIDYKTSPVRPQSWVDDDLQLTAYAFALARGAVADPETGLPLGPASRLGLWFVEGAVVVWTTRSASQLAAFEARLVDVVVRIRASDFPARPSPSRCGWCDYAAICETAGGGS